MSFRVEVVTELHEQMSQRVTENLASMQAQMLQYAQGKSSFPFASQQSAS